MPCIGSAINPVAGPNVNPQFDNTVADRFCISHIALLDLPEPSGDSCFCELVP